MKWKGRVQGSQVTFDLLLVCIHDGGMARKRESTTVNPDLWPPYCVQETLTCISMMSVPKLVSLDPTKLMTSFKVAVEGNSLLSTHPPGSLN